MKPGQRLFEEWMLAAILTVQVVLVCAGVLSRYFFNWSLSFTEELTRYLLIWLACLGLPACWARGEMIGFQWPGRRSARTARILAWLRSGAGGVFFLMLLYSSLQMIRLQWQYDQRTSVMGWPVVWVSLALPAASLLFFHRAFFPIKFRDTEPGLDGVPSRMDFESCPGATMESRECKTDNLSPLPPGDGQGEGKP